jgi:glycine hydroxymethyltransferase
VDVVEQIALIELKLFGAEYANVQPHSGSQANTVFSLLLLEAGR